MHELTEKDFQTFKDEAEYWLDLFGLKDWRVDYDFDHIQDAYAECRSNWNGKCATLALSKWQDEEISENQIRQSAFHEVCELLLVEVRVIALDESIPSEKRVDMTDSACHGVIRRMENSVFKMKHNN